MRFLHLASIAAALAATACNNPTALPDTITFAPGVSIQYHNQAAQLYGTAPCTRANLHGNSCLVFSAENPQAIGIIITPDHVYQLNLRASRDPSDPARVVIEDETGLFLLGAFTNNRGLASLQPLP